MYIASSIDRRNINRLNRVSLQQLDDIRCQTGMQKHWNPTIRHNPQPSNFLLQPLSPTVRIVGCRSLRCDRKLASNSPGVRPAVPPARLRDATRQTTATECDWRRRVPRSCRYSNLEYHLETGLEHGPITAGPRSRQRSGGAPDTPYRLDDD